MNSDKMTARVAGVLYHTEKRNALDWLRDKMTARTAGLLYFVNGAAGFFSYMIVPKKLIVQGNATATANNILVWLVVNPTIRQGGIGMASWWASRLEERSLCCVTPYACTRNPRA